jgi:hypothetical protein
MFTKIFFIIFIGFVTSQGVPDSRCPAVDTRPPVHLPHPTDCTRYYICRNGLRFLMPPCPPGSFFDIISSTCIPGECDNNTTTTARTTTTAWTTTTPATTTTSSTTTPSTTTSPATTTTQAQTSTTISTPPDGSTTTIRTPPPN